MGKIIALANQKGGVAKTTSTHNIGVALAKLKKKVLLVDLDSQASLTISVGLEPLEIETNIVNLLDDGEPAENCIQELGPNLHIIPSIIDLANTELILFKKNMNGGNQSWAKLLQQGLEPVLDRYDYILIDCPPQLSVLTLNALSCADEVLIPAKTDYLSYRGLIHLTETIESLQRLSNPKLQVLGVIATLYETRVKDDNEILDELKKQYNVLGVIKKMAAAKKGIYDGKAVVEKEPSSEIAKEYTKIAKAIVKCKGV